MPHILSAHWAWVQLNDICEMNPRYPVGKYPDHCLVSFLPMKNVEERTGRIILGEVRPLSAVKKGYTFFENDDVLFAKITPCMENGKVAIAQNLSNGIGFGSTELHVLRCRECLKNKYLFYFLIQSSFRKVAHRNMTGTAGQLRVPKTFLENTEIPLPPLDEQHKIVEKIEELFSELDNSVAELKKAKAQLRLYRQSVLASAFAGRMNNENLRMNNEELPAGWKWVKLGEIANKITDGEHIRPNVQSTGVPFLSAKDVRENDISFDNVLYVSDKDAKRFWKRCDPERGDILIVSRGATVGRLSVIETDTNFCLLGSVILIKINYATNSRFVALMIKSPQINKKILNISGSTAQQAIYLRDIKNVTIPLPPFSEQQIIVDHIEKRFAEADGLEKAIDEGLVRAEMMRQGILKRAFEGKLLGKIENE